MEEPDNNSEDYNEVSKKFKLKLTYTSKVLTSNITGF